MKRQIPRDREMANRLIEGGRERMMQWGVE